jgi:hypothetical protein
MKIDQRFLDQNRIPFLVFKSIRNFHFRIAIMIAIEKLIWIDHYPIFILTLDPDFLE